MKKWRVIFENKLNGSIEFEDILAYNARSATNQWKDSRSPLEREVLKWCGCFATPSQLFSVDDFS